MCQNEVAILAIIKEQHKFDSDQQKRASNMIARNIAACNALRRQGFLKQNRSGQLQITRKGNYALTGELLTITEKWQLIYSPR